SDGSEDVQPPKELWEYVRQPVRASVLAVLDTLRRNAGRSLTQLFAMPAAAALPAEARDALRVFLCREPVGTMKAEELQICAQLPILPVYPDGLSLPSPGMASGDGGAGGGSASTGGGAAAPAPEYAAASEQRLFLMFDKGILATEPDGSGGSSDGGGSDGGGGGAEALASGDVRRRREGSGRGSGGNGRAEAAAAPAAWTAEHLLTSNFVWLDASDGAEVSLALRMGVTQLNWATFLLQHVLPRLSRLPAGLRDAALGGALIELPHLSQQDARLKMALASLAFLPTVRGSFGPVAASNGRPPGSAGSAAAAAAAMPRLVTPSSLFDPEMEELQGLLPEWRFPKGIFAAPDILAGLRALGLQQTLDWDGLVEVAAAIQEMHESAVAVASKGVNGDSGVGEAAAERGRRLLLFMDTHAGRLFPGRDTSHVAFFRAVSKMVTGDAAAEEQERRRLDALSRLMALDWVPVYAVPPSPLLPRCDGANEAGLGFAMAGGAEAAVVAAAGPRAAAPAKVRPAEDMWLCSHRYHQLNAEVHSPEVRAAFGWTQSLQPTVVATQAVRLAAHFNHLRGAAEAVAAAALEKTPSSAAAAAAGGMNLEQAKQMLAGVVPRVYQALSAAVEKDAQGEVAARIGAILHAQ
ncbi:unnamed protein product, partial [Phaeothamnion confervicola]